MIFCWNIHIVRALNLPNSQGQVDRGDHCEAASDDHAHEHGGEKSEVRIIKKTESPDKKYF